MSTNTKSIEAGEAWNGPSYRYIGIAWMHPARWYELRFGKHVDAQGRLYVYLGRICLWQDVIRFKGNGTYASRWFGFIEVSK